MEEEEITSPSTMIDPWSMFLYGMKAPMSREKYRGKLNFSLKVGDKKVMQVEETRALNQTL